MDIQISKEKEQEIRPLLSRLYNAGADFMESTYKKDAGVNWEFYHGTLPRPSHKSMMPAKDRSVYIAVETALKDLVEIFTSGEDAVSFAPLHNQDAYSSKAATQLVNQIFLRNQNGKSLLQDALKTALVERSAIFKAYWATDEKETHTVHEEGLASKEEILHYLVGLRANGVEFEDEDAEIIQNKEGTFDVTLTYRIPREYVKVELLPMEEFIIEPGCKSASSADCSYACHRVLKTKEQLKEYGLTDDELAELNDDNSDLSAWTINAKRTAFRQNNDDDNGIDSNDPAFKTWVKEHHWKTGELSDDGSVRLYKLFQVGEGRIFKVEEEFSFPFYILNPIPLPHSPFGVSYASTIADLQCDAAWGKQVLHTYTHQAAIPSWMVNLDNVQGGDLSNPKPGAIYKVKDINAIMPMPQPQLPPIDSLFALVDKEREERSGVNPSTAGLTSSGIETNRSSEAVVNNLITLATGRVRQMAHSIANGGYSELFRAIYNLYKDNSSRPIPVQTAYGVQPIHPSQLVERDQLVINIALTTQEKQKRAGNLKMLADFMAQISTVNAAGFVQPQHTAWMIQEMGNYLGFPNTFDFSTPLQQYQAPGMDQATQVQLANVQADTQLKQAQANKLVADDHHTTEMNLFTQQRASKEDARLDKELEMKVAYNADHFDVERTKLAVGANSEALKHQHAQERQANENYQSQTQNLKVQASIIQKDKELNTKHTQGVGA